MYTSINIFCIPPRTPLQKLVCRCLRFESLLKATMSAWHRLLGNPAARHGANSPETRAWYKGPKIPQNTRDVFINEWKIHLSNSKCLLQFRHLLSNINYLVNSCGDSGASVVLNRLPNLCLQILSGNNTLKLFVYKRFMDFDGFFFGNFGHFVDQSSCLLISRVKIVHFFSICWSKHRKFFRNSLNWW